MARKCHFEAKNSCRRGTASSQTSPFVGRVDLHTSLLEILHGQNMYGLAGVARWLSGIGRRTCDPEVAGSSPGRDAAAQQP